MNKFDLVIPQASQYRFVINVVGGPASLVGYTGKMQIRESPESEEVLADLGPSEITVNDVTKQVVVTIPSTLSATYTWNLGVYDLYIVGGGGDEWRLVEGNVRLSLTVTR
jgi:hypothetical protein